LIHTHKKETHTGDPFLDCLSLCVLGPWLCVCVARLAGGARKRGTVFLCERGFCPRGIGIRRSLTPRVSFADEHRALPQPPLPPRRAMHCSKCGTAISQAAYFFDGNVYCCVDHRVAHYATVKDAASDRAGAPSQRALLAWGRGAAVAARGAALAASGRQTPRPAPSVRPG